MCGRPLIRVYAGDHLASGRRADRRCHTWSMSDKPRFRLLNVKDLTRLQRWIMGVATLIGVFGLVLCLTGRFPLGILCLGLSAMTNGLTNINATRRGRST